VFGAGPIGIGTWFALRSIGAGPIIVAETSRTRRATLEQLGADCVLDSTATDLVAETLARTDGEGAAVAIDAAGVAATAGGSLQVLRSRGCAVTIAVQTAPAEVDPNLLLAESTWTGSSACTTEDFNAVIAQMAIGHHRTDGSVEHIALDDLTSGLDAMAAGTALKLLVDIAPQA
jgi:(R,R)-butanediol dehydrogenase/meso-butanediol dehydrogenase/diacetyl reductase